MLREPLTPLEKQQIAAAAAEFDPNDPNIPIEFYEFLDANGVVRYEAPLVVGEDGPVYIAGTMTEVAGFAQGGVSHAESVEMDAALEAAFDQRSK